MRIHLPLTLIAATTLLASCGTIAEQTNTLSDESIANQTAGVLGYPPSDLTVVSRRTSGVNTYVEVRADDGKSFSCVVNGGNLLSFGMTNPPSCAPKGQPVQSGPGR
jgi:hypothetical protein